MSNVLIMLGGLGTNKFFWDNQLELKDTFDEVIPLELLGHGDNLKDMPITLENMANDIIQQIDDMDIEKFHLMGLSIGGIVSQEIIRKYRKRVKSLILVNTLSWFPPLPCSIIELFKPLSVDCPDRHLDMILNNALHIKDKETLECARKGFTIHKSTYEKCARSALYVNYLGLLNGWMKPVLIITGTRDNITNKWYGQQSYNALPFCNTKKKIVELNCGHLSNIELPEQFNNEIRKFYNKYLK